jgi:hypothetical protein
MVRMAAGVNVRSVGTIRDGGDVYAFSPQVDSGRDYFQLSPLPSPELVATSLRTLGCLVFLIVECILPLVSSLVLSIRDFFSCSLGMLQSNVFGSKL